jgi:hypothetical protein
MDSLVEFCTGSPITQGKQVNLKRTMGRGGAFQVGVPFCVPGQSFRRTVPVVFLVSMCSFLILQEKRLLKFSFHFPCRTLMEIFLPCSVQIWFL